LDAGLRREPVDLEVARRLARLRRLADEMDGFAEAEDRDDRRSLVEVVCRNAGR
jgi:hypothetical protein